MGYKVNAGFVMVRPLSTDYGPILKPYDEREMNVGRVVGVGTIRDKGGRIRRPEFAPGDTVVFEPFTGYEYKDFIFIPYEFVYSMVVRNDKRQDLQNG